MTPPLFPEELRAITAHELRVARELNPGLAEMVKVKARSKKTLSDWWIQAGHAPPDRTGRCENCLSAFNNLLWMVHPTLKQCSEFVLERIYNS